MVRRPIRPTEDQIVFLPGIAHKEALFVLVRLVRPEQVDKRSRDRYRPFAAVCLRWADQDFFPRTNDGLLNPQDAVLSVHVLHITPTKAEQFAASHTGVDGYGPQWPVFALVGHTYKS